MPLSYVWSDNQSPQVASGVGAILNIDINPATIVEPWVVTLTVTDDEGAVSVMRRTVPISRADVEVRGLYVAAKEWITAAPGGHNWWYTDSTDAVSCACSTISAGVAVFGTTDGKLYRTTDFLRTAPTLVYQGFAERIADIEWDAQDPDRVWAVGRSGRVLVSQDAGATWTVHSLLRSILAEPAFVAYRMDSQPRGVASVLRVFGGDGHGEPVVAYAIMPTVGWQRVAIGGELRTDIDSFTDSTRYVRDGTSSGRDLAIILNSASHHPAVYYTADMLDASKWKRATGSIDGVGQTRGQWIERDLEGGKFAMGLDDTAIYLGLINGSDAMQTYTALATLPAGYAVQYGFWLGRSIHGMSGVYLLAVEEVIGTDGRLYKTTDRFASIDLVKAGPNDHFMVAVGPAASPIGLYPLVQRSRHSGTSASDTHSVAQLVDGDWALVSSPVAAADYPIQFTRSYNGILFRGIGPGATQWHQCNLERSTDGGVTWVEVFARQTSGGQFWGVSGLDRAGDGRLWLCASISDPTVAALPSPAVYVSDDDGATWTLAYQDTTQDDSQDRIMSDIACHPTDPMLIYVVGGRHGGELLHWFSDDGGVTFSGYAGGGLLDAGHERQCVMMANRRILLMHDSTGDLYYSDDYGANLTATGTSVNSNGQIIRDPPGQVAFVTGAAGLVKRSLTFGASWESFTQTELSTTAWTALAYHEPSDTLLLASDLDTGTALRMVAIEDAGAVVVGDVLDLSLNISALFTGGAASTMKIARQGIMLP